MRRPRVHVRREHRHPTVAAADVRLYLASDPPTGRARDVVRERTANDRGEVHNRGEVGHRGEGCHVRWRTLPWRKRPSWLASRDLPVRTSAGFEIATNVDGVPGDRALLEAAGWSIADPLQVSTDPFRYRDYICDSRGEFTVAKDLNVRLRSGWFSDRAACYLAAGRPCVEEDTAFGDVLPLGPGLHAFRTVDEAAEAVRQIEADPARASAHAAEIAREYFAADRVLARMLAVAGC